MPADRLGEILRRRGVIDEAQLEDCLRSARRDSKRLGEELLRQNLLSESQLYSALAEQFDMDFAPIDAIVDSVDRALVGRAPRPYLENTRMVPVRSDNGELVIAVTDPNAPVEDLASGLGFTRSRPVLITPSGLRRLWSLLDFDGGAAPREGKPRAERTEVIGDAAFQSRLDDLFDGILRDAIGSRASDVHLEVYGEHVRLRYRIDGNLQDIRRFEILKQDLRGLVNVVKVGAELDISERRLPQGGRMRRDIDGQVRDFRVQVQPARYGEHLVLSLGRQDHPVLKIENLGFSEADAERYRRRLNTPEGIMLVVGPAGAGKSTTLHAGLRELARDTERKVVTIEDPIEQEIAGVQQTQLRHELGFGFADAMRAMALEDADVIVIGEIRDTETALEAIRASQTGRLVLSTLHCDDSVDAIRRLRGLGVNPATLSSELAVVISQRLVRRICPQCRAPAEPDPRLMGELFPEGAPTGFEPRAGKGCERCRRRGTLGRIVANDFLVVDAELRRCIAADRDAEALREAALRGGLKPLRERLIELVTEGVVPLSELPRSLSVEQLAPASG